MKVVQLTTYSHNFDDGSATTFMLVLCDDGTIWRRMVDSSRQWERVETPPSMRSRGVGCRELRHQR